MYTLILTENVKAILCIDNLLSHCYYVWVLCSHVYMVNNTYYGQLHIYYNTLQCKSALSIHKMNLKFEKYTCLSKTLTCQKTASSILI